MKLKIVIMIAILVAVGWVIFSDNPKEKSTSDKEYTSVIEYEKAMYDVQKQYPAFKFSVYIYNENGKHKNIGYVKGNKWIEKVAVIPMFDEYFYSDGTKTYFHMANGQFKEMKNHVPQITTQYKLTKWNSPDNFSKIKSKQFTDPKANINGMPCRMINYVYDNGNKVEVCISDKYGVALYYKFDGIRNYNGKVIDKKTYSERIEVFEIDTKDLSDSMFR